jgi:hypothetical protein
MPETINYQDVHTQHHNQQLLQMQQNGKNKFLLMNPIKRLANKQPVGICDVAENLMKKKTLESGDDQQKYYSYSKNNERTVFKHMHSSFLIMPDSVIEKHDRDAEMLQAYLIEKENLLNEIEKTRFNRSYMIDIINLINKFLVKYYMLMNENFSLNTDLIYFKNLREKILMEISNLEQKSAVVVSPVGSSSSNSPSPSSSSSTMSTHDTNTNLITFGKLKQPDQAHQQSIVVNQSSPILKKTTNAKPAKTVTFNNNISLITQFDDDNDFDGAADGDGVENEVDDDDDDDHGKIIDRLMKKIHLDKNYQRPSDMNNDKKCELCCQSSVLYKISDKYCENCFFYMKTKFNLQN